MNKVLDFVNKYSEVLKVSLLALLLLGLCSQLVMSLITTIFVVMECA